MDNAVVSGIPSGVVTGVVLGVLAWAWQRWGRWTNTEEFTVALPSSPKMQGPEFKFGVIHARNDDGTIINRVHWFRQGRGGKWHAAIRHPRNIGFQYKSFVDYESCCSSDEVIKWLAEERYENPNLGEGKPNRVWFILPDKPTASDPAGPINNHYYPE